MANLTSVETALKSIADFSEEYAKVVRGLRHICFTALHNENVGENRCRMEGLDPAVELVNERAEARVARKVLEQLGLTVDHYVCDAPIFKEIEK